MTLRVGLIGFGTIGKSVVDFLQPEVSRGELSFAWAAVRDATKYATEPTSVPLINASEIVSALDDVDLVIECAGVQAAIEHGPAAIAAGRELLLVSVGSLANEDARVGMFAGPGRLTVTNGGIGGFDALGAAAQAGGIDEVSITTSKGGPALVRPWMDDIQRERLESLVLPDEQIELFVGSPAAAIEKFPANVNVAVALSWAVREALPVDATAPEKSAAMSRALDRVRVRIVAVGGATRSNHVIRASGAAGEFTLEFSNAPAPTNPRTSAFTPMSVARDVRSILAR